MEEIKITLETLYDILRNEKKREDLQKLESTFYADVASYLREKKRFLEQRVSSKDIFSSGERDKLEYELRSIQRILKEIYERREKKIIDISLNRSRTGSDIIDTSSMLIEEKEFYRRILAHLDEFRTEILLNLFQGEMPKINITILSTQTKIEVPPPAPVIPSASPACPETNLEPNSESLAPAPPKEASQPAPESPAAAPEAPKTKIKFTHPLPSFVWKDMKEYGPFNVGDVAELFSDVAELIVRKGRADKVE